MLLGTISHMGTESYRKGSARGGFPHCLVGLEPCTTHQHPQGCPMGIPSAHQDKGPSNTRRILAHQFTTNFQSRNQGERQPRAVSPPLCHQTRSPRCYRNVFPRGSNARASPAKPTQPHVCPAGQAAAAPSHCLHRCRQPHLSPLAGAGLPNSVWTLAQPSPATRVPFPHGAIGVEQGQFACSRVPARWELTSHGPPIAWITPGLLLPHFTPRTQHWPL